MIIHGINHSLRKPRARVGAKVRVTAIESLSAWRRGWPLITSFSSKLFLQPMFQMNSGFKINGWRNFKSLSTNRELWRSSLILNTSTYLKYYSLVGCKMCLDLSWWANPSPVLSAHQAFTWSGPSDEWNALLFPPYTPNGEWNVLNCGRGQKRRKERKER